ncbi:MAG: chromatin protein Cren7 [Aeropyrum sp.]|nr:chromatin protein Cren7 [Aeropyrum sp.]MCE4616602.1 chromatin protein Cren7 [Aeropyrum sp.]
MARRGGRRKQKDPYVCPSCGARAGVVEKTWSLVSPLPDKYGRITVTIMAVLNCSECGYSWKAPIQKMKTGGEEPSKSEEPAKRQGQVIELDLDDILSED